MGYSNSYANEARRLRMELGRARSEANLFRSLLSETDSRLHQAWSAGNLPANVMPSDLIERTRAALAGEAQIKQPSLDEIIAGAVQDLAQLGGTRL